MPSTTRMTPEQAIAQLNALFNKQDKRGGQALKPATSIKPRAIPTLSEAEANIRELEESLRRAREAEWQAKELVLFICHTRCLCGAEHMSFEPNLWVHEVNPHTSATRYHEVSAPNAHISLPRVMRSRLLRATVCPSCFQQRGL